MQCRVVLFGYSEDIPVGVIRITDLVIINIVLIGPGPCEQIIVADRRRRWALGHPSNLSADVGSRIAVFAGN